MYSVMHFVTLLCENRKYILLTYLPTNSSSQAVQNYGINYLSLSIILTWLFW